MYLLLPLESFTSLLNIRDISKRKRWRSRPLRIRVFGSQTWNDSWRMSSPCDSMFSSKPGGGRKRVWRQRWYSNINGWILTNSTHHLPAWTGALHHWLSWEHWASPPDRPLFLLFLLRSRSAVPKTDKPTETVTKKTTPRWMLLLLQLDWDFTLSRSWYLVILCTGLIR